MIERIRELINRPIHVVIGVDVAYMLYCVWKKKFDRLIIVTIIKNDYTLTTGKVLHSIRKISQ